MTVNSHFAFPGVTGTMLVEIDNERRIKFPKPLVDAIKWLQDKEITKCRAFRGPRGGIQIDREGGSLDKLAKRITNAHATFPGVQSFEAEHPGFQGHRLIADSYVLHLDPQRRVTIPEQIWKLGVLPSGYKDRVVVWGVGEVVEVWNTDDWNSWQSSAARERVDLLRQTLEWLESRNSPNGTGGTV